MRARLVTLGLSVLILTAACGAKSDADGNAAESTPSIAPAIENENADAEPQPGGELVFGLNAETTGWNPYEGQWAAPAYIVANAIFDPLVAYDDVGQPQPYLAESLTPNDDFTEWEIGLRPDVSFHNGEPFDADALVTNLERGRVSGLTSLAFDTVTAIETVDELTVRVTMNQPYSTFPLLLSSQAGYMAAPAQLADDENSQTQPIGTGPFSFVEWIPDDHLEVTRNDDYWQDGLPYLDGIDFKVLPDDTSRGSALESGEVDAIEVTIPAQITRFQELAEGGSFQLYTDAGRETDEVIITLNTAAPPFDDPTARLAVATAIDRPTLSASGDGVFPPAWGPYIEESPAYLSPEDAGFAEFDTSAAAALAAEYEAEHGEPLAFTFLLPPDPALSTLGQILQEQLATAGIDMQLQPVEQTEMIQSVLTGDYQSSIFVLFNTPTLDRGYSFIASEPPEAGLTLNISRFLDPELVAAMVEARTTDDPALQAESYQEVQRRFAANNQIIFLLHRLRGIASDDQTFGFQDTLFPGTDEPANAGFFTTPFTTAVWVEQ